MGLPGLAVAQHRTPLSGSALRTWQQAAEPTGLQAEEGWDLGLCGVLGPGPVLDLPDFSARLREVAVVHGIEVRDLHQHHGKNQAVDDLSLGVTPGKVFGLVDPDGAAQTTMMEILGVHPSVGISGFLPGPAGAWRRSGCGRRAR